MKQKILADRTGYQEILENLKGEWIKEILIAIGMDDDFFDLPEDYQRDMLIHSDVYIEDYADIGACMITFEGKIIGEWLGPSFKLVEDDKGLYYEITLESWSILEDQDEDD